MKHSEETQGQGQNPEETMRGWREAKELTKDLKEVVERKHREYEITEAKGWEHFKEKYSQQVKYGWEEYLVWTERCPLDCDQNLEGTFRFCYMEVTVNHTSISLVK